MKVLGFSTIHSTSPFRVNGSNIGTPSFGDQLEWVYCFIPKSEDKIHLEVGESSCYIVISDRDGQSPYKDRYEFLPHTEHWLTRSKPTNEEWRHLCYWSIPKTGHELMESRLATEEYIWL